MRNRFKGTELMIGIHQACVARAVRSQWSGRSNVGAFTRSVIVRQHGDEVTARHVHIYHYYTARIISSSLQYGNVILFLTSFVSASKLCRDMLW